MECVRDVGCRVDRKYPHDSLGLELGVATGAKVRSITDRFQAGKVGS